MNNSNENLQYDSCISKGICSVSPRTAALTVILIIYLKLTAKYYLKLCQKTSVNQIAKELILNTVTVAVSHQEFNEQSFNNIISQFKEILPEIIKKCSEIFEDDDFKHEDITLSELFTQTENIIDSIKLGERIIRKTLSGVPVQVRDLHLTMMVMAKSLSINLLDLESLGENFNSGFITLLELIDFADKDENNTDIIKEKLKKAAETNNSLMLRLREAQEQRYGVQTEAKVSYTTTPGKAVLVAGSNIRELETVLEALKDTNIDIYTHDDMMLAHTFPKFNGYSSLKGQYGQGLEHCLIDFATFPGPIILTKHSLHNIDNLYRGRLFTTDYILPQGVIKISNNDYSEVITSALSSRGFKRGKVCESVTIGYNFEKTVEIIKNKVKDKKRIFMIGLEKYSLEQKTYFEKLIKTSPKDTLIISFSYNYEQDNLIHINTCFDSFGLIKIFEVIKNWGLDITIFMPKCDRHTISQIIYISGATENIKVYVGKCTPILLNPSLMHTLKNIFNINEITNVKKDIEDITSS